MRNMLKLCVDQPLGLVICFIIADHEVVVPFVMGCMWRFLAFRPATLVGDRPLGPLIWPAIRAGLRMI